MSDSITIKPQIVEVLRDFSPRDKLQLLAEMVREIFANHGSDKPILLRDSRETIVGVLTGPAPKFTQPLDVLSEDEDLSADLAALKLTAGPLLRSEV